MSVAGASLVVAIGLTALACANWLWLRLDPQANASHLPALADVALVALALHALALVATGTTSPAAYGLTIVLACAAAAVRRPSAMAGESPVSGERDAPTTAAVSPKAAVPRPARFGPDIVPPQGAARRTKRASPRTRSPTRGRPAGPTHARHARSPRRRGPRSGPIRQARAERPWGWPGKVRSGSTNPGHPPAPTA